jgi:hypothetical protein
MSLKPDVRIFEIEQGVPPREDLSPYIGKWAALRDGYFVAAHRNPAKLRARPEVEPTDVFVAVQEPGFQLF